jgi:DNA gyrase/topoisomerase IV subunit B
MTTSTTEDVKNYVHLDQRSHVLAKSGMYIGNAKFNIQNEYILKDNFIQLENINYNEGLVRIFLEILTNATDNVARSKVKNIEQKIININIDKQWIEISNDGSCIPIELTKDKDGKDVYVPELLFGYLLSSSNYDDNKSRVGIGGTFGVGASLTNIFSKHFEVIIKNKDSQKEYKQIWKNNMSIRETPSIKSKEIKSNLITIKYLADFNYFGCNEYSDDIINHITKLIYDASLNSEINIKLNGNKIGIKNMLDYVKSYYNFTDDKDEKDFFINKEFIEIKTSNSYLIIVPNYDKDNFDNTTISFVNGIFTFENGIHVNEFENIIFKYISEKLSKKNNVFNVKDIKPFFKIFLKCQLDKPTFNSQLKSKLTSPKPDSNFDIKLLDKIIKWNIIEDIKNFNEYKQDSLLKKNLNSKRKFCKIANYDFANKAGSKDSHKCTLFLVEGNSAKTFATKGIKYGINGVSGRDYFGIYPLRGKMLNVRNATNEQILKNKEINDLIQILNLKTDIDYTKENNFNTLNYGKIIILTDADSITFDSPCLIKNIQTNMIEYKPICEIYDNDNWIIDELTGKEYNTCTKYLTWSSNGWTAIKSIMRHKLNDNKKIFRVNTHTGVVDVTEDHSLLDINANEITVKDCKIKETELLHNKYIQENNFTTEINKEYAFALGYFAADGHCSIDNKTKDKNGYEYTNSKWVISCIHKEPMENLKNIFEKYETFDNLIFEIAERKFGKEAYSKKEFIYTLEAKVNRKEICTKYRNMFYNSLREKKVPTEILNSSKEIQQAFIDGFYQGDGIKCIRTTNSFDKEYKSFLAGMFHILQNCDYKPSINANHKKLKVYRILMGNNLNRPEKTIKKLFEVTNMYKDTYVYDFETENHHFHGGIGNIIVHNTDGNHIKGLIINTFDVLFPTLIKRKEEFISAMLTPIITVKEKNKIKSFFDEYEANDYIITNNVSNVKYYKGLGTSNDNDIKENFGKKIITLEYDKNADKNLNKAFNSKKGFSDDRKEWIMQYDKKYIDYTNDNFHISKFIDEELIRFSIADNKRSLPHVIDGLKESQRKILYATFLKNLKYSGSSMKVAQLGAFAAEKTNYAHGENSLFETIIKMAQNFTGSNNINLLFPDGQLGSRVSNGDDAASPRYIFTKFNKLTELIYNRLDEPLYIQKIEDGDKVEFENYCPILPMLLVNGAIGIGTGFSCNIPCYNPLDIINYIQIWIKNKSLKNQSELIPWYHNFKGTIKMIDDNKFETYGIKEEINKTCIKITEIPIGVSIDSFKEKLDDALEKKIITSYQNHSTTDEPSFIIKYSTMSPALQKILELKSCLSTSNMTCFDINNKIKKYDSINEIIEEFCIVRLNYYLKRKEYLLKQYEQELLLNSNKYRFINAIINDEINIYKKTETESIKILETNKFDKINDNSSNGYNYLLNMFIKSFTKDRLDELKKMIDSLKKHIKELKVLTPEQLWENDLTEFKNKYIN